MANKGSILASGNFLYSNPEGGDFMASPDWVAGLQGGFTGTMFDNGNFAIQAASSQVVWQSGALSNKAGRYLATLQSDGDFTIQEYSDQTKGWSPVWRSSALSNWSPPAPGSEFFARLRNDGHLTVFQGTDEATNYNGIWTTAACLQLDGSACVVAPNSYAFGLGDFTIECWLALNYQNTTGTIISTNVPNVGEDYGLSGFSFSVTNDGAFHFSVYNGKIAGDGIYTIDSAPTHALDGNFHHVAAYRQNCGLAMYFDTEPLFVTASGGLANAMDIQVARTTVIGAQNNGSSADPSLGLVGSLAELRIWGLARSQEQIFANSRRRIRSPGGGLLAVWPFSSSGMVADIAGGNNGTASSNANFGPSTCPTDLSIYP